MGKPVLGSTMRRLVLWLVLVSFHTANCDDCWGQIFNLENVYKQRRFTPLHQAGWDNNTAEAKRLIAAGADVNAVDIDGSTPTHSAAYAFGADVIAVLVEAGADVNAKNKRGMTPLHAAMICAGGAGDKAIPYLLKAKADVDAVDDEGCTPLLYALQSSLPDESKVRQLIAAGADVNRSSKNGVSPLHWACSLKTSLADALIAAGANVNAISDDGKTPLHYAASGQLETVRLLLKAKADPNVRDKKGWSPLAIALDELEFETAAALRDAGAKETSWTDLHEAVLMDDYEAVEALVKAKPKVNATDTYGRTPLYWALRCSGNETADLLIAAGADLTRADKRHQTILHVAAWAGHLDAVKKAIAAGANVNATDDHGYATLHWATASGKADLVQFLLDKGANVNAQAESGETPLMLAIGSSKTSQLAKPLLKAGADVLIVDKDNQSIEDLLWKVFDKEIKELLQDTVADALERRIDRISELYSNDRPDALKADSIQPTTPNLAAVKMYRALFGPDKSAFVTMFVGRGVEMATVAALYDATQEYVSFRKELTKVFGKDACRRFNALQVDGVAWTTVPTLYFTDESGFEQMKVDVQGDRAICPCLPGLPQCGDVVFVRQAGVWRIDADFLTPPYEPEANFQLDSRFRRSVQKGRAMLRQSGSHMEDIKRAMWKEFRGQ